MAKYLVTVKEVLSRTVVVEAIDKLDAENIVQVAYDNAEMILDADDFLENYISARDIKNEDLSLYSSIKTN